MSNFKKMTLREITMVGVFAALVFVASNISIPIPTPLGNTRIHLGNVLCILSGLMLGSMKGGLSAGIGSMFFDLFNPLYIADAPLTFIFKFLMAYTAGFIAYRKKPSAKTDILGGALGAILYVVLYLSKNFINSTLFLRTEVQTAFIDVLAKGGVSLFNAIIAVVIAVPLAAVLRRALPERFA